MSARPSPDARRASRTRAALRLASSLVSMVIGMVTVTFSLDDATVERLRRTASRLGRAQSQIVREAVAEYAARADRLSESERRQLLAVSADWSARRPRVLRPRSIASCGTSGPPAAVAAGARDDRPHRHVGTRRRLDRPAAVAATAHRPRLGGPPHRAFEPRVRRIDPRPPHGAGVGREDALLPRESLVPCTGHEAALAQGFTRRCAGRAAGSWTRDCRLRARAGRGDVDAEPTDFATFPISGWSEAAVTNAVTGARLPHDDHDDTMFTMIAGVFFVFIGTSCSS